MGYSDLLSVEGITSQYLAVIKPRRFASRTSWAIVSGTKYVQNFTYGEVIFLDYNDSSEVKATSSSLSDGTWFYDTNTSQLYVDFGINPSSSDVVATYEIYVGTFDAHFNRDPLDPTTRVVYYEPLILKSPNIQASNTDILYGFLPTISTAIQISNLTQLLQPHLYDSSFNRCDIAVYHWLGELITENIKLVTRGICGSINSTDETIEITIYDNNDLFDAEFRHLDGISFYAQSIFPNLDPNYQARAMRKVYGIVDSFIPVNIDYEQSAPTNLTNRTFLCVKPATNLGSVSKTVPASPSSTATRTYLNSADGIVVGDSVWIKSSSGSGFDESVLVTTVNKTGSAYIEHAVVVNIAASASIVLRSFIAKVTLFQLGVSYVGLYGKHYIEYIDLANNMAGFTLATTFESALGAVVINPADLIYARVYGNTNNVTLEASPFGSDSPDTGNLSQAIVVLYDLFKTYLGLTEAKLDLMGFSSAQTSIDDQIGFAIPYQARENFPSFKTLFTDIATTILLKLYINDDNLFAVTQTGPSSTASMNIADDEILDSSFNYNFDYSDLKSDIFIEYAPAEVSFRNESGQIYYNLVNSSNNVAMRLHKIQKQQTFQSLHFLSSEAQKLSDRLAYAFGDRRGTITFTTKNRFFGSEINDVTEINRTKIPGFEYNSDTLRTVDGVVISTDKSLDEIVITLDDQKGIEDHSSSW